MTDQVDIVNQALQTMGTRTTVTAAEITAQSTNEAIQSSLIYEKYRRELLRMAPWDCGLATANLVYITSVPGTPENSSPATPLWQPGQPAPPWAYEFQYPVDCLRACWLIPSEQTGVGSGVPITTAITGFAPTTWLAQPIKFKVQTDQFFPVTAAAVVAGGAGYVVGEVITLPAGPITSAPIGAPVKLRVATAPGGVIATVTVVNQILGSSPVLGGSYFAVQGGTIAQYSTTGSGIGATFTLTFGAQGSQRVILTNQQNPTLSFVRDISDPNVMDELFQKAWINTLGAGLAMALTGDKGIANQRIVEANRIIDLARSVDGNEGLTINDVTPDWIRIRGINFNDSVAPYGAFDWGPAWPSYA